MNGRLARRLAALAALDQHTAAIFNVPAVANVVDETDYSAALRAELDTARIDKIERLVRAYGDLQFTFDGATVAVKLQPWVEGDLVAPGPTLRAALDNCPGGLL